MLKRIGLGIAAAVLLVGIIFLWAQAQDRQGPQRPRQFNVSAARHKTLPKSETEKKILAVLDDIYLTQSRGLENISLPDGKMLRLLAESLNAKHVVEIGAADGYSGIWLCLALQTTGGRLTTFNIESAPAELARDNFKRAGVEHIVTVVEGDARQKITELKEPIDLLFINADPQGYTAYLEKLLPLVRPGGLILAGLPNNPDQDYLKAVTADMNLDTVFFGQPARLSITLKKRPQPELPVAKREFKEIRTPDVIFVPTPQEVVDKMLELAQVKKEDVVYDLGCGDGRIVVTAAKKFGCRAYGYDIDPQRVRESLENVQKNNVGHLVTIDQKDIFTLDLSPANVVTLYLLPSLNVKLIPQLEKLKPGSRIVSHDFDMKGVQPDKVVNIQSDDEYTSHTIYLWTTPLKKIKEIEPELTAGYLPPEPSWSRRDL